MVIETLPPPIWVANTAGLNKTSKELALHTKIAVDTESNSLHAYREQLCLIQFSTELNDFLVDALEFSELISLAPIFSDPQIEKIFHAAEYDLICLKRSFGISVTNIFDTMQAARILGYKQVGLDAMLAEKLGVVLNKKFQKADWAARPLPPDMMNYARLDTHHLIDLRDCLEAELEQQNRLELAHEEFNRLANGNGVVKAVIPSWQRIGGTQKFNKRQLAILNELASWRETQAERMNRPVFKVIDDKRLVEIAQAAPKTIYDLEVLMLTPRQVEMYGHQLLQAVERGRQATPITRPRTVRPKQSYTDRLNALSSWRKAVAKKIGVESDLVLPKAWMHAIAEQNPATLEELAQIMLHSPWRMENFGKDILNVIHHKKVPSE